MTKCHLPSLSTWISYAESGRLYFGQFSPASMWVESISFVKYVIFAPVSTPSPWSHSSTENVSLGTGAIQIWWPVSNGALDVGTFRGAKWLPKLYENSTRILIYQLFIFFFRIWREQRTSVGARVYHIECAANQRLPQRVKTACPAFSHSWATIHPKCPSRQNH